jgi:hypothetical protein
MLTPQTGQEDKAKTDDLECGSYALVRKIATSSSNGPLVVFKTTRKVENFPLKPAKLLIPANSCNYR